jgi:hypothetical protein
MFNTFKELICKSAEISMNSRKFFSDCTSEFGNNGTSITLYSIVSIYRITYLLPFTDIIDLHISCPVHSLLLTFWYNMFYIYLRNNIFIRLFLFLNLGDRIYINSPEYISDWIPNLRNLIALEYLWKPITSFDNSLNKQ